MPTGVVVAFLVKGQPPLVLAVHIHHVQLAVAVAHAGEHDPFSIRRNLRANIHRLIVGELLDVFAVGIAGVNLIGVRATTAVHQRLTVRRKARPIIDAGAFGDLFLLLAIQRHAPDVLRPRLSKAVEHMLAITGKHRTAVAAAAAVFHKRILAVIAPADDEMRREIAGAFVKGDVVTVGRHGGVELMFVGVVKHRLGLQRLGVHHHESQQRTRFIIRIHDFTAAVEVTRIALVGAIMRQPNGLSGKRQPETAQDK